MLFPELSLLGNSPPCVNVFSHATQKEGEKLKGENCLRLVLVKMSNQLPGVAEPSRRRTPYNITCIAAFPTTPFGEFQS